MWLLQRGCQNRLPVQSRDERLSWGENIEYIFFGHNFSTGVYNLMPRSCHQFDQDVFIYNT